MGQAFAARYRQSAPIVTYGVTPRAEQLAPNPDESDDHSLIWSISGAVPSAAALALGALAFATTSDLPKDATQDEARNDLGPAAEDRGPAVRVAIPTIPMQLPVDLGTEEGSHRFSAEPNPIAASKVKAGGNWQPATSEPRRYVLAAKPAPKEPTGTPALAPQARTITELSPFQVEAAPSPAATPKAIPEKQSLASIVRQTSEAAATRPHSLSVEMAMAPAPRAAVPSPSSREYIRRDYSNTLAGSAANRDTRLGPEETARLAAATSNPSISGQPSPESVQLVDGKLASVKLGEVLKLVETQMDPAEYAALANSTSANSYVGPEMMKDAGIEASFDVETFTLALSALA